MTWKDITAWVPAFCFGYPFVMAWYWMAGGVLHNCWLVWLNYMLSILWSYAMLVGIVLWILLWIPVAADLAGYAAYPAFSLLPDGWGAVLTVTYLTQAAVSLMLDHRYEGSSLKVLFWQAWYPVFFWLLQAFTAAVGLPKAIMRIYEPRGTWVSPDRGVV